MEYADRCPVYRNQYCSANYYYTNTSLTLGEGPAIVSIISSTLSCLGSLLIVYTYLRWKDIRTGSRSIITFLAIADFFTAFGYVVGSSNYLANLQSDPGFDTTTCSPVFTIICQIQSYLTSWSSISSFVWTTGFALYLFLTLVHSRIYLAVQLIPWFHIAAWGLPIAIFLPLLVTGHLGFSPYAVSTWCFIAEPQSHSLDSLPLKEIGFILVGGKLWEILTYAIIIILYSAIKCHVWRETQRVESRQFLSSGLVTAVQRADRKLTFIPIIFILLRIWGTIQFFYSIVVSTLYTNGQCIPEWAFNGYLVLGCLQAIGDGGQGWGNVILYIIASAKIRKRLFGWILMCQYDYSLSNQVDPARNPLVKTVKEQPKRYNPNHPIPVNQPGGVRISVGKAMVHYTPENPHVNRPQSVISHEPTTELETDA